MAKLYGEIAKSALLTLDKSFSRALGQPLDASEVYYSLAAAKTYAATPAAYVGQKIVVIEDGKVTHYSVEDTAGTLKEVGVRPTGDGKSVTVTAEGVVSILGVEAADSLTLPRMKEDKSGIEWVPVSQVVKGDGNDNTTYDFALNETGTGIVITTKFNGTEVEDGVVTIDLDVYTKGEVDNAIKVLADKIGVQASEGVDATGLYELIANEVTRATEAEVALSNKIGVAKDGETAATGVYAYVDGVVETLVNGVDADKIDSLNELIAWVEAHPAIVEELDGRLDKVEAILDGIGDTENSEKATVKAYVDDALDAHELAADGKYATQSALAEVKATADAAQTAGQVSTAIGTALEAYYTSEEVDATLESYYTSEEVDGLIEGIEDKFVNVELDAEKNIIEVVKVNGTALEVDASDRSVNVVVPTELSVLGGYSDLISSVNDAATLAQTGVDNAATAQGAAEAAHNAANTAQAAAEAAQGTANTANAQANTNKTAIEGHATRIGTLEGTVGGHVTELSGLTGRVNALEGEDVKINGAIGTINAKVIALEGEDARLAGLISANTTELAKKALATDVTAINDKIGTVGDGADAETVYGAIAKAKADATYDDTAIKTLISDEVARADAAEKVNAKAIADETARADAEEKRIVGLVEAEADRADAAEKANAKAISDEATRAKAAEEELAGNIADLDNAIKAVLDNEGGALDSIKELATWVEEHGEDAAEMAKSIEANTGAISALDARVVANETAVGVTLPAAIAQALADAKKYADDQDAITLKAAKDYADAQDAIILADAKKYTDDTMVKADGTSIQNTNGTFSVKAVSTDVLTQGAETLILNGGNASLT